MPWSEQHSDGFLLAAAIAGDRAAALGVAGLAEAARAAVQARIAPWTGASRSERLARVKALTQRLHAPISQAPKDAPARALAAIAPLATHQLGQAWLAAGTAPRPGYVVPIGLRRTLRQVAERGAWNA